MATINEQKLVMTEHFGVRQTPQLMPNKRKSMPAKAGSIDMLSRGMFKATIRPNQMVTKPVK